VGFAASKGRTEVPGLKKSIAGALFAAYLVVLLDLTLREFRQNHPAPNWVPFHSIRRDIRIGSDEFLVNFLGNLVAFLPPGFLAPWIWPGMRSARRVALLAAALSGSIEAAQYVSGRRVADVDDVILNIGGALLGYASFLAIARWHSLRESSP
jgi:glycopeptide antibiotics resistance protein